MDQIGRYRILDELGRGATGVVYRAQDPAIGRIIAIKTIRLSDITDTSERERLRERLLREAQSAGMLSHPNIVTIYDIAEENGLAYIFMECVDGPPLEKLLNAATPIGNELALSVLLQTAIGLDYAHEKGIVHRDIKPANILIHERGQAKITDFGVAKIVSQQMTQAGVMMGTPNYMSPEQVQGHAVDGRADEFSLAVIAYEMLTGEKPFLADQLPALLFRIVREDPVAPDRLNASLGPQVEGVLKKALAKSANDRYPTCVQFVEALTSALQASPGWHPLPRSSSHTLPTMGGIVPKAAPAGDAALPQIGMYDSLPFRDPEPESRSPLLKSLVWMLVGIGLVGLVLFGAQKYLFNRSAEPAASDSVPIVPAAPSSDSSKPSPVGQSPDGGKPSPAPAAQPETTAPAAAETRSDQQPAVPQETPAAPAARPQPERPTASSQAAAATAKSPAGQSVQFLTEPAGAQIIIDGNSSLACKTPCMLLLESGRHALSAQMPGFRPYPRVFNVPQDGDLFLQLSKAMGTLSITSQPAGATIEVDGTPEGKRTPALFNLAPGSYHIKVARSGAFIEFDVQLRDGEFINKRVDF